MDGDASLEETLREENTHTSLPVITISSVDSLRESGYRLRCARRLVEIVAYLEQYMGVGRLFIP